MDIKEYENFYHVDISMQIDNKWNEDSSLGIVKNLRKYSIVIKGKDKEEIKRKFIIQENSHHDKIHNKKVIAIVYSYLLYKALCDFPEAKPLLLCRDVRPEKFIITYFQKIAAFFKNYKISDRIIKFRKRAEFKANNKLPKSLAGKYARKVFQKRVPATKIFNKEEINELTELIGKLL